MKETVVSRSFQAADQAGRIVRCLKEDEALEIAGTFRCTLRRVYEEALRQDILPYRYLRNRTVISRREQLKLLEAVVAVAGTGGLGGSVIEILARTGVGRLILIDHDVFEETNLNRQIFCSKGTVGLPKAEVGASRVRSVNPAVETMVHQTRIDADNGKELLSGADVVVDALDTIRDRLALEKAARALNIPLVHAAVAGFEGRVMTIFPGDPGLVLLYGGENAEKREERNAEAVLGVPAATPALIAALQAMEVVKIILHRGEPFRNRMIHADLEAGLFSEFRFPEKKE